MRMEEVKGPRVRRRVGRGKQGGAGEAGGGGLKRDTKQSTATVTKQEQGERLCRTLHHPIYRSDLLPEWVVLKPSEIHGGRDAV